MFEVFLKDNAEPLMYLLAGIVFSLLLFLAKKKVKFSFRVLTAMTLGILTGFLFKEAAIYLKVFGNVYIKLIKVIMIPLVLVSVIKSFTQLDDMKTLKKIGLKTMFWLLSTAAVGAVLGLVASSAFRLGTGFSLPAGENKNVPFKLIDALYNLIPSNIISHAANNEVIQVIFFAILVAVAIIIEGTRHPERVKPFKDFIYSAADIMNRVTKIVIRFTPYGAFGLAANAAARNDAAAFKALVLYILIIYGVMLFHFIVVHLGLITFVAKLNPFTFIRKVYPAQVVALTTQSSLATLPVTIKSLKQAGVSDRIANFSAPLGATMGMNACAGIYPAIVAVFTANAYGIHLGIPEYVTIILTTVIASIGIAGVPGIASVVATVVLASVGLPLEGLLLVMGVEAFVDMGRTALNVTGAMVASTLVARSEHEFDQSAFNSPTSIDADISEAI
jgi:Na+/H+-dicarboxylate symporter